MKKDESEETEVKKDLDWLKNRIKNTLKFEALNDREIGFKVAMKEVLELINQLDEPEVLSSDWIKDNQLMWSSIHGAEYYILANKLYGKIVPKQEDINKEKQEAYVKGFEAGEKQTVEFYEEHESKDFNKKVNQLIKAIENPKRIKLRDVIERMDVLSEKNRNDWIERVNKRYEVEEEQKYQVIIRDGEYMRLYLCKNHDIVTIGTNDSYIEKRPEVTYLTEQEIKDYDERFWPFAVKVEELEG